jgi:hypothetical protein
MISAIRRGLFRITLLVAIGVLFIAFAESYPEILGIMGAPLMRGFGLCFIGLAAGDLGLRILQPHVDTQKLATEALANNNIAAGVAYLGRCILAGIVLMLIVTAARAEKMPPNAYTYVPLLQTTRAAYYPEIKDLSILASQIEQETCNSLKSSTCFSPNAQLKTYREQGVGFGQLTRAYNAAGIVRFDVLSDVVNRNPRDLKGYSWANWSDPTLSMRAYVLYLKQTCRSIKNYATLDDKLQMCLSAYNGGLGGINNDILSCKATAGCNPKVWFGNVERTSSKSKTEIPGYGRSAFTINRGYVKAIYFDRRKRYVHLDALV